MTHEGTGGQDREGESSMMMKSIHLVGGGSAEMC